MEKTNLTTRTAELAGITYKNMKMGSDSIINLMPKVEDEHLRSHMSAVLDGYEKFASQAKAILDGESVPVREEGLLTKMSAKMGIGMKTIADPSVSHIGEMLMEGATQGICESIRALHTYEHKECREEALQLVRDIISFEENNFNEAKSFL